MHPNLIGQSYNLMIFGCQRNITHKILNLSKKSQITKIYFLKFITILYIIVQVQQKSH